MALLVPERSTTPPSDPALDTGADGRTLLQARVSLYGQVLTATFIAHSIGFVALWRQGTAREFFGALREVLSVSGGILLALYLLVWLLPLLRPLPAQVLRGLELSVHVGFGLVFSLGGLIRSAPVVAIFDVAFGLLLILTVRALVVPSSWKRTAVIGVITCAPIVIAMALEGGEYVPPGVKRAVLVGMFANWSLLAIAVSTVASGILYGLRRQVRDAQRLGQYTLLERLGHGGMGVVYRARHAMLRRPTAIKLLTVTTSPEGLDRFEREVQQMAALAHPNIATVFDYGRTEDGALYYAMELLDGADLDRVVRVSGPLPPARVIHVLVQVCRALADAHAAGLVHRDVKPANLFLCRRWGTADAIKVLDFGLVKETSTARSVSLTTDGAIVGTPMYMAPEMWMRPGSVDARADLYSVGAVGYFLLTGRPVFEGETAMAVMMQHTQVAPEPPSRRAPVPADLEAVLLRCLAKDPDQRYASAEVLRAYLEECADAGAWTSSDARDWWTAHERALERPAVPVTGLATTAVQVDPGERRFDDRR